MKRITDYFILLLFAPLWIPALGVVAALVKLTSPGPALFTQKRVGRGGATFTICKFRTMRTDTPGDVPTHLFENPDAYITPVGRVLRKTSLDELPQIFNILKGDMTLVGPRPALWNQYDLICEREKYGANDILPGLTGLAQVNGRDNLTIEEKAERDGYYRRHMRFGLDAKILLLTVINVIGHSGVREGRAAGLPRG
ncbi:MAG: sugar transferase [Clostridiales bacterium]|nr:sugar transferase [Clostridiales bacterium]